MTTAPSMRTAIAALALAAALSPASSPARAEATAAQRAACTPDVWRLCASEIPNVDGIKACLRRQTAQLSAGCRVVMETADRGVQTASAKAEGRTGAVARN